MRILHVDPAKTWRGGERQVLLQARELARRGHECVVAASPGSPLAERAASNGLPVFPLAMSGDLDLRAIARLAGRLRRLPPDLLHLHTARAHGAGGIAARLAGFHPVLVTRRVELVPRGMFSTWKYRTLADHFVSISEAVAQSLRAVGVSESSITRIPSGIEIPEQGVRTRPSGARVVVGTLGAFTEQKDPSTWIEVARRVMAERPDVDFVWWGEGEFRGSLQEIANRANLGTRIDLSGFHEQLDPFWRHCDVFFLPSKFEALGTVLLDAMAHGIPIVASRVGGIPEVVRPEREGLLVEAGDVPKFVEAIGGLLDSPDRARSLGDAGRTRALDFDIRRIVDRLEELYAKLAPAALLAASMLAHQPSPLHAADTRSHATFADSFPIPAPVLEPVPAGVDSVPFGPPESMAPPPPPRPPLPDILPFGPGELLEFSIDYGIMNAGGAVMEVGPIRRVAGRPAFDIRTEAKSNSVFSKIYKVWDRSQTHLDAETILPLRYEKRQREGTYKKDALIKFDRTRNVATYQDGLQVKIHPYSQDELSSFYYMRMFPIEPGKELSIETHSSQKNFPLKVLVHGRETVTVPAGTFDCWVIEPVIREGGIFTAKGKLTIWVTADERRMPVLMRTKILVGSISASLVKYKEGERGPRLSQAAGANR